MTTLTLTARLGLSVCQEQLHLELKQTSDPLVDTEPNQTVSPTSYERFANFIYTTQGTSLTITNEARAIYAGKELVVWVSYETR